MKKGDIVDYTGKLTGQIPLKNCVIEGIDDTCNIFNQPMATLVGVDFWVSLRELVLKNK